MSDIISQILRVLCAVWLSPDVLPVPPAATSANTMLVDCEPEELPPIPSPIPKSCFEKYESNLDKITGRIDSILAKIAKKEFHCWDSEHRKAIDLALNKAKALRANPLNLAELAHEYDKLLLELSYCRSFEITKATSDITKELDEIFARKEIDRDAMLAHILGDVFAKGTDLEGLSSGTSDQLVLRNRMVSKICKVLKRQNFIEGADDVAPCHTYFPNEQAEIDKAKRVDLVPDLEPKLFHKIIKQGQIAVAITSALKRGTLADFLANFRTTVQALDDQDSFYFSGGWPGHAIIYSVKREGAGYTLRVFNMGQGAGYNLQADVGYPLMLPFVELVNVPKKNITDYFFLRNLYDFRSLSGDPVAFDQTLQNSIQNYLGGTPTTRKYEIDDFFAPQISGTCGYYTIPLYHKFLIKEINMDDLYANKKRNLLEAWIESLYLNYYMNRLPNDSSFDDKNFLSNVNLAERSLLYLNEKTNRETARKQSDMGFNIVLADQTDVLKKVLRDLHEIEKKFSKTWQDLLNLVSEQKTAIWTPLEEAKVQDREVDLAPNMGELAKEIDDWQPTSSNIIAQLEKTLKTIQSWKIDPKTYNPLTHHAKEAMTAIEHLALKIPVDCSAASCPWRELFQDPKNSENTILIDHLSELLLQLGQEHFWAIQAAIDYNRHTLTVIDLLVEFKLYTALNSILDQFYTHTPVADLKRRRLNLIFREFKDGRIFDLGYLNFLLAIKSAPWMNVWEDLRSYWKNVTIHHNHTTQRPWEWTAFAFEYLMWYAATCKYRYYPTDADAANDPHKASHSRPVNDVWDQDEINYLISFTNSLKNQDSVFFPGQTASEIEIALRLMKRDITYQPSIPSNDRVPSFYYNSRSMAFLLSRFFNKVFFEKKELRQQLDKAKAILDLEISPNIESQFKSIEVQEFFFGVKSKDDSLIHFGDDPRIEDLVNVMYEDDSLRSYPFYPFLDVSDFFTEKQSHNSNYAVYGVSDNSRASLEEQRILHHIISVPRKSIAMLLANYRKHSYLLREAKHQIAFEQLLFRPGFLEKSYQNDPKIFSLLADFVKENYFLYRAIDTKLAAYFLRLNQLLLEQALNSNASLASLFLNSKNEILSLLKGADTDLNSDRVIKNIFFRDLSRTYIHARSLSDDDIAWLLTALFYRKLFNQQKNEENALNIETAFLLEKFQILIKEALERNPKILDPVASFFLGHQASGLWQNEYPIYKKQGFTLDLHRLMIEVDGKDLAGLPEEITNHPLFNANLNFDTSKPTFKMATGYYSLNDQDGEEFRAFLGKDGFILDRMFGGKWLRLLSGEERAKIDDTRITSYGEYAIWKDYEGHNIFLFQRKTTRLLAKISADSGRIARVSDNDSKHDSTTFLWQANDHRIFQLDPDYSLIWGDDKGEEQNIDYPRLGLNFFRDNKNLIACRQYEDFFLQKDENFKELEHFPYALKLSDKKHQNNLVLIPRYFLRREPSLSRELAVDVEFSKISEERR